MLDLENSPSLQTSQSAASLQVMPRAPRRGAARRRANQNLPGNRRGRGRGNPRTARGSGRAQSSSSRGAKTSGVSGSGSSGRFTPSTTPTSTSSTSSSSSAAALAILPKFKWALRPVEPVSAKAGQEMAAKLRTLVFATFNQTGSTGQQVIAC